MSARQTTGRGLSADEVFIGLLDHGLFAEKLPPCFSSEGLAVLIPKSLKKIGTEKDEKKLGKLITKQTRGHVRYQVMRDVNIPRHMGIPHPQSYAAQSDLRKAANIDDCICDVLLLEYATRKSLGKVRAAVTKRADNLKGLDPREQDAFWPLIYQVWSEAELRGNGQDLLADLKKANFAFVRY